MAWDDAREIQRQLFRLASLFVLYLLVLLMIALSEVMICDFCIEEGLFCQIYSSVFGFVMTYAMILSFALPFIVNRIHTSKMDKMITFQKQNPKVQ